MGIKKLLIISFNKKKFMRKIVLLLLVLATFSIEAFSQTKAVTGTVTGESGIAVPFATITEVNTKNAVSADSSGNFSIQVKRGATLEISATGYQTLRRFVGNESIVNVNLEPSQGQTISEVVVTTALGIKRQAKELGYAATTLSNATVTKAKAPNVQQALNGKVSGLNVTTVNSSVFEDAKINIRGIRSLTGNNQPMLVLDGQPTPLSFLSTIAPDDIQDLTISKSSTSAAIYGPDAVNGVIFINTKRGTNGDRPIINFSTSLQMARVAFFPKLQHEFGAGAGEEVDPYGNYLYVPYENQIYGPRFDGSMKMIGRVIEDGSFQEFPYTNQFASDKKKFWNTGMTLQNQFSYMAKNFYFGLTDAKIKGLMPDDKNRRTTFRLNAGNEFNRLSINYGLDYTLQNWDIVNEALMPNVFASGSSYVGSVLFAVMQTPDNVPITRYKDWRNDKWAQYDNYFNDFALNPYWIIGNLRQKGTQHYLVGHADLAFKITSWLKANAKLSSTITSQAYRNTTGPIEVSDWAHANRSATQYTSNPGKVFDGSSLNSRINLDYFLNGENKFGDFNLKYILGGNVRQDKSSSVGAGGNNQIVKGIYNVNLRLGEPTVGANGTFMNRIMSAYGSALLGYKGWAFVEFTGRNDWDSRLSQQNYSVFYPSVNGSLILSDAISSLKNSSLLSYLKVRGGYSKSGNVNLGVYALEPTYSQFSGFPYGTTPGFTAGNVDVDPNLTPEFVKTLEAGVEAGFFKNRINVEATYFNQNNDNQILLVNQSPATGYRGYLTNAASFKNYGVELDLGLTPLVNIGTKGKIDLKINATYNDNEVTKTLNGNTISIGGNGGFIQNSVGSPSVTLVAQEGSHAFMFQGYDYARDPATGKVIVDAVTGYPTQAELTSNIGRTLPLWVVGATPSFSYGNLSLSLTWDYKTGHTYFAGMGSDLDFSGISARSAEYGRQRFVFPNSVYYDEAAKKYVDNKTIMVQDGNYGFWTGGKVNTLIMTNYLSSAAAVRLRELNLSYIIPQKLLGNVSSVIKKLTVSAIGRNLLIFVPKSNQWGDPEFNYSSDGNTYGVSSSYQSPASRFYGGTISIQF
ncbi:SusC/RagA family TonB-linked outer membrane protein [Niabella sp. CC-SYL272]|uniref:SusC/RagA family TonB-linked outer membrane protein n=1 Tax=Niabella agricola TaxID=2891571 RepID=UPI001F2530E9|nr:SusC/RagA family TonB-linked outer membrane protein [Niabella agricola]MCF3111866.1 SusC/RagA family TonB-linked outer membrane protein [Niabella agricola]